MKSALAKAAACVAVTLSIASVLAFAPLTSGPALAAPSTKPERLVIYHVEGRRSERVIWLAEELGVPYNLNFRRRDLFASIKDLKGVNPLSAMAPTITYDGRMMAESGAILEFVQNVPGKGRLQPKAGSPDYMDHLMWLHYAEGSAIPRISGDMQKAALTPPTAAPAAPPAYRLLDTTDVLAFIEDYLSRHPYFGGKDFSTADIMMHFTYKMALLAPGVDMARYPHFTAWKARVESRPAYRRAIGPGPSIALPDGWAACRTCPAKPAGWQPTPIPAPLSIALPDGRTVSQPAAAD